MKFEAYSAGSMLGSSGASSTSGASSSFSFFRPGFFFFSGVILLEPGMKCEKISVCFSRKSNLLLRFVSKSLFSTELGADDSF